MWPGRPSPQRGETREACTDLSAGVASLELGINPLTINGLNKNITRAFSRCRIVRGESGLVGKRFNAITVIDGNGDQMTVYEIWDKPRLFGFIADRRLELHTGEAVEELPDGSFVVASSRELLKRVEKTY